MNVGKGEGGGGLKKMLVGFLGITHSSAGVQGDYCFAATISILKKIKCSNQAAPSPVFSRSINMNYYDKKNINIFNLLFGTS